MNGTRVFTWTDDAVRPSYMAANLRGDGSVEVSVRGAAQPGGRSAPEAAVLLGREDAEALARRLSAALAAAREGAR